jgi:hypothetical protein
MADSIRTLKLREIEFMEMNKALIEMIENKEKQANQKVDGILRKYERFQVNLLKLKLSALVCCKHILMLL